MIVNISYAIYKHNHNFLPFNISAPIFHLNRYEDTRLNDWLAILVVLVHASEMLSMGKVLVYLLYKIV